MKNMIKIPYAEYTFVETDAQAREILHVVTKLPEKPGTLGFDPHAKLEMEAAIAKMRLSPDNPYGCYDYHVHWGISNGCASG
jgi:hypothetical protein